MRKLIITALMMLTATTAVKAQNELYIYQQSGQTDTLQLEQVATISHSRIDRKGAEQTDYVVMAIRMTDDSEHQYVLAQVDSVVVQRGDVRTHLTHFIGGKEPGAKTLDVQPSPLYTSLDGDFTTTSTAVNYFWQEGDHIYLDGGTHDTGVTISESKAVADFAFEGTLTADTYTVYYNGQTPRAYNTGCITTEQSQSEENNSDHIGLAGDCGTAVATKDGDGYRFNLDHHAAYLCFMPYIGNTLERTVLKKVTVHCDQLIAGDYTFSTSGLTLNEDADNLSHAITLTTGDFLLPERATKNTSAYMVLAPQSGAVRLTCEFTVYDQLLESTGVYTKTVDLAEINSNTVYVIKANCNNYVVDLGLPVKFMNHNVGAFAPEECGGYYAWGELEDKGTYNNNATSYALYNKDVGKDIRYTEYDVAYVKYGKNFSLPTVEELYLLNDSCKAWTWTTVNGISGYKVTGKNDNHLFLPAAGYRYDSGLSSYNSYGYYRSSQLVPSNEVRSPNLYFRSSEHRINKETVGNNWSANFVGNSVRPVVSSGTQMTDGTLVQVKTEGVEWNVGATTATLYGAVNGLARAKKKNAEVGFLVGTQEDVAKADLSKVSKLSKDMNDDGTYNCDFNGVEQDVVYYYRAYIKTADDNISYAGIHQFGRELIDLGLPSGNLWSNINLGASSPDHVGAYYAWAEPETKTTFTAATHTTYKESTYLFPESLRDVQATRYDAVAQQWGSVWMTPDYDDLQELVANCTFTQTSVNGMAGYRFTSKNNGKSIFIPRRGYRSNTTDYYTFTDSYVLSSQLYGDNNKMYDLHNTNTTLDYLDRTSGYSLRPVYKRHPNATEDHPLFVRTLSARKKYDGTVETDTLRGIIRGLKPGDTAGFRWWKAADGEESAQSVAATADAEGYFTTIISSDANSLESGVTYCFQAYANDGTNTLYGKAMKFTAVGTVDLGLSVNWLNVNVGAENEGAQGYNYRWGAIEPYRRKDQQFTAGTALTPENGRDIASLLYGGNYRMPTKSEYEELMDAEKCTWTWNATDYETVGYVVTGKGAYSDHSIFIPAVGYYGENSESHFNYNSYARYWAATVNNASEGYVLRFQNNSRTPVVGTDNKRYGFSVRAVQEKTARVRTQGSDWTIGAETATLHGSAVMTSAVDGMTYGFVVANTIEVDATTAADDQIIWANNRNEDGAFSATYTYDGAAVGAPRFFRSFIKIGDQYFQGNIKAITSALLDVEFLAEAFAINGGKTSVVVNRYTSSGAKTQVNYHEDYHRNVVDLTENGFANSSVKLYHPCYFGEEPDFSSKLADGHSLEVLYRVKEVPNTNSNADVMASGQSGGSGIGIRNKHINAYFYIGNDYQYIETDIVPQVNTYYHVVGVWDKEIGQLRIYVNGELAKTLVNETMYKAAYRETSNPYYLIGGNPDSGTGCQECFNGHVAFGRVYGEALTTEQVQQLYNALKK